MKKLNMNILYILQCLLVLVGLCLQPVYAKDRIRYHINGVDGSTLQTIDEQGVTVSSYRYAPFGEQLALKKLVTNKTPVGFVGGVHDQDDLVYLKHRYYNPIVGRFYQPDPITYSASGKLGQIHRYQYGWNDPFAFKDSSGLEPTQQDSGNLNKFINGLNTSPSRVGLLTGTNAAARLLNWGRGEIVLNRYKIPQLVPREAWLNTQHFRYIYSEKVGWLDMQHFMYYAGSAYAFKQAGYSSEFSQKAAMNKGFSQEFWMDLSSLHSRFSYEDLVSDLMGSYFGAYSFNSNSPLTLGQQLNNYLNSLNILEPSMAPNWSIMPLDDSEVEKRLFPTKTNWTTTPMYINQ